MSQLSLLDLGFVLFETRDTPLHVTGLIELEIPADRPDFARELYAELLKRTSVEAPFNQKLQWSLTQWPRWRKSRHVDLSQHVHLSALPAPGTREQLIDLVSRLHSQVLDHNRPLWSLHVIDGVEDNKVVLCLKIHHAAADGMRLGAMFKQCTSLTPEETGKPFWNWVDTRSNKQQQQKRADEQLLIKTLFGSVDMMRQQMSSAMGLLSMGTGLLSQVLKGQDPDLKLPFTAPKSPFNQKHRRARGIGLAELPLPKIKQIARLTGASFNDTVLTVCDMALQRYMQQRGITLNQPLVGLMPINLRKEGDSLASGNKFGVGLVEMGMGDTAPAQRLAGIQHSTKGVKHQAQFVSPGGYYNYSIAVNALDLLAGKLNLSQYLRPATNLILSNVPGPSEQRYFYGAKILANYPLSLLVPGQTLNITMYSYQESLLVGLVSCRTSLPGAEAIADYLPTALEELEQDVMRMATHTISDDVSSEQYQRELARVTDRSELLAEASALLEEIRQLKVAPQHRQTTDNNA